MLNYFEVSCQTKKAVWQKKVGSWVIFATILLKIGGCTSDRGYEKILLKDDPNRAWKETPHKEQWFTDQLGEYQAKDQWGRSIQHPFFDFLSNPLETEKTVSFFLVSPARSHNLYDFDLLTGKNFIRHPLCEMKDIWGSSSSYSTSPYHEGIIPRLLNGVARPQRIWVFGDIKKEFEDDTDKEILYRAKIVGGVIRRYCFKENCREIQGSESTLILIGVVDSDPNYAEVNELTELKSKVNWDEVTFFAQNGEGVRIVGGWGDKAFGAYRLVGEVSSQAAFKATQLSHLTLHDQELAQMQTTCIELYEKAWNRVGKWKWKQEEAQMKEIIMEKLLSKKEGKEESEDAQFKSKALKEIREATYLESFFSAMQEFHQKHGNQFKTCIRFVKGPTGTGQFNKNWFLAYLEAYYHLLELGHAYDCKLRDWRKVSNPQVAMEMTERGWNVCAPSLAEESFSHLISYMGNLQQAGERHYRYIEFDQGPNGTHQQFYNWVREEGTYPQCKLSWEENKKFWLQINRFRPLFPNDVKWTLFIESGEKVIY